MGWSSRQVWGFTALMLGVIVMTIVSMVTLVLLLTMDGPPEGQPLLIATPTITPPTDKAPPLLGAYCNETPSDALIFLPQSCAIVTSPSTPSSLFPNVEFLPHYNMRRCSNQRCHGNSCQGNRCCCQVVQTSSLTYYCPNERSVLVENIVEKCGCVPCIDVPVVFVGKVTNTDNEPIPMATVKVNNIDYQANNAIFGFSVSSLQEEVVMDVVATGYWDYKRLLRVLPGEVNILQVRLMRKIIRIIPATPHSVIISTFDLRPLDSDITSVGGVRVETVVQFPRGVFRQGATLIGQPVAMENKASLEGLGMSFITGDQSAGGRRKREGGEGRVVFVVSVGLFNMEGERGEKVASEISGLVSHTLFPPASHSCTDLASLQLYLRSGSALLPVTNGNTTCSESETQIRLTIPLPDSVPLPINLVIGSPSPETCYIAVKAFENTSSFAGGQGSNEILSTQVWVHTELAGPPRVVNVITGVTRDCVPIPCHGEMVVRILDGLQYSPDNYTVHLDDDVIMTSDDVATEAEVYRSMSGCEENALIPSAKIYTYFRFIVKPQQPTILTPNNANLTTPPFCSLRVGVTFSGSMVRVFVTATSEMGEGVRMVRVERMGEEGGGEEEGSGICRDCGNKEELSTCLQVSCDHQIEVGVSRVGGEGVCVPQPKGGGEGVRVEDNKFLLVPGDQVTGLVVDYSSNPSVAMEMCKLMITNTSVQFNCQP